MSPRRSSTSSAERTPRPRYLGVEVTGEPFPSSPSGWTALLRQSLGGGSEPPPRFRIVRASGPRAIVEVSLPDLPRAREAWARGSPGPAQLPPIATRRTWGTLQGAKAWLGTDALGEDAPRDPVSPRRPRTSPRGR